MRKATAMTLLAAGLALGAGSALAAATEVQMLNRRDGDMFVYSADLVRIAPGDSVTFVPTSKGHDARTIEGIWPDGVDEIRVGFNQTATVTFTSPGIYGVRCAPHLGAGMVTAIVVGEPVNLYAAREAAAKLPPKARDRLIAALSTLD